MEWVKFLHEVLDAGLANSESGAHNGVGIAPCLHADQSEKCSIEAAHRIADDDRLGREVFASPNLLRHGRSNGAGSYPACCPHSRSFGGCSKSVGELKPTGIPDAHLATISFPCTDLSAAGGKKGIRSGESAAFWDACDLIEGMGDRMPRLLMLENVAGLLRHHGGTHLQAALDRLQEMGYAFDLLLLDAAFFVPQSRPRLFIVADRQPCGSGALPDISALRPPAITSFMADHADLRWDPFDTPAPPARQIKLRDVLRDPPPRSEEWWSEQRTDYLLTQMRLDARQLVEDASERSTYSYFPAFRRMREWPDQVTRSTAEVRTDGLAGCLRTPKGGSARQIVVRAGRGTISVRHMSPAEYATLMGASDFRLDPRASVTDALFGFADAVCVPAIRWIRDHQLEPRLCRPAAAGPRKALSVRTSRSLSRV